MKGQGISSRGEQILQMAGRHGGLMESSWPAVPERQATRTPNDGIIARALLSRAYVLFSLGQAAASHQLVWQAEEIASTDYEGRVRRLMRVYVLLICYLSACYL